jgi:hypothetical protein
MLLLLLLLLLHAALWCRRAACSVHCTTQGLPSLDVWSGVTQLTASDKASCWVWKVLNT